MNRKIYLAGGCFWGMDHLFSQLKGVVRTTCGYANGSGAEEAVYTIVKNGETGFRETIEVVYDDEKTTLVHLLDVFFQVVDPVAVNQQGHDIGTQYQSGIYSADAESSAIVKGYTDNLRGSIPGFAVEVGPLMNFFEAEEYHQKYLVKNPGGYCHIPTTKIKELVEAER